MQTHDQLRQLGRERRAALDETRLRRAALALADRVTALDVYRDAQSVSAYIAVNGEIDLGPVIDRALAEGKQILLPIIRGRDMRFAAWNPGRPLRRNAFGLAEPEVDDAELIAPSAIDLVLAPLTVFDADCNRIGMGGGYYDRGFAFRRESGTSRPVIVGVAHDMQKTDHIAPNAWDVRPDMIATDLALYSTPGQ